MKTNRWIQLLHFLVLGLAVVFLLGACAAMQTGPKATLTITPDKVVLTPALLKNPIVFSGTGFEPNEMVILELQVPEGLTIKGLAEGENAGIGNGNADAEGNFSIKMGAITTLMTFFQTEWDYTKMGPDFSQASPLPPGDYDILASSMLSERTAQAVLTVLPKPAE